MGGLSSILTTALPTASSLVTNTVKTQQQSAADAAAKERDYAFQLQKQQLDWQHEEAVRQQEQAAKDAKDAADKRAAEQQRASEMNWLTQSQNQAADQLRANQARTLAETQGSAQTQLAQLAANADAAEKARVAALRKAMARTRATLGASGVSSADGSGEAILLGQVGETQADRQDSQQADQIKQQAIQQTVDDLRRRNLLEQAQLADKQRLEFMSRFY